MGIPTLWNKPVLKYKTAKSREILLVLSYFEYK